MASTIIWTIILLAKIPLFLQLISSAAFIYVSVKNSGESSKVKRILRG